MLSKSTKPKKLSDNLWFSKGKSKKTAIKNLSLEGLPDYESLYESHALSESSETVVGNGDFSDIGFLELSILKECGLREGHSLMDLGCGSGRLARHVIPFLETGDYTGIEISETILSQAKSITETEGSSWPEGWQERTTWLHEVNEAFPSLSNESFDYVSAFSVFTHMDAEDTYRYIHRIGSLLKPGGRLIASFLLLEESEEAREIFIKSAASDYQDRRQKVLCVCSSRSMVNTIAKMCDLEVETWFEHDSEAFEFNKDGDFGALGQSVVVLRKP